MPTIFNDVVKSNHDDFASYPEVEESSIDLDDLLIGDTAISMENDYSEALLNSLRATYEGMKADDLDIVCEGVFDNAREVISWFQQWLTNFKNAVVKYFTKLYQKVSKFKFKASKVASAGFVPVKQFVVKGYEYTFDYGNQRVPQIINDILYKTQQAVDSIKNHSENVEVVVNRYCNELGNASISIYRGMLTGEDFVDAEYYEESLFRHFHGGADRGDKKDILITTPALRNFVRQVKVIQNVIKNCENDKERMKNDTERIINWIKTQSVYTDKPTYHFEDEDKFSENRVGRALAAIYSHANNILKRAHFVCAKYYSEKLHALDEAIQFYDYVLGRAQGSLDKPLNESSVYQKLEDSTYYSIYEAFNAELVEEAISELYLLTEAWEAKELVIEADNAVQVGVNKAPITRRRVTGIFGNIKEAIRKILAFIFNALERFNEAVANLLKTDVQWVADNNALLNNLPPQVLQTMTLNYTNYMHTNAHQRIAERNLPTNGSLRSIATRIGNEAVKAKQAGRQLDGAMTCYKNYFPQLYKLDPNNWKNAALRYYRGGSNGSYLPPERKRPGGGETVMARGADCQQVIKNMTIYVLNYKQYSSACVQTLNQLRAAMNEQNSIIDRLSKERGTLTNEADISHATFGGAMYSILENSTLMDSDLVGNIKITTSGGLDYLREELGNGAANPQHPIYMTGARPSQHPNPQQAAQQQAQQQQPQQQAQQNPPKQNQQQPQQQQQNAQQADYATEASRQLIAAYQVCSSICTAKLTVCEEIERSYMRVLRGVAAAVQKYNGDNDKERSNRQYNQERQEDRQAAQDERLQKIRYRNEQKKARNTGLIGGMRNILGV